MRNASREGKGSTNTHSKIFKTKFDVSQEAFNAVLDDLECEIVRSSFLDLLAHPY
jgi:hypothetical protein